MSDRLKLTMRYVLNNRIDEYNAILHYALKNDYIIIPMSLAREKFLSNSDDFFMVLRHDIDEPSPGTLKMAQIEADIGLRATYYFRWCTFNPDIVKKVAQLGHEISLHYETFASFVIEKGNEIKEIDNELIEECRCRLKQEILSFNQSCKNIGVNPALATIASHGHEINAKYSFPNNHLVKPEYYSYLGINYEAYDAELLSQTDRYISDQVMEINGGYLYGVTPFGAINNNFRRIIFLTHPNHWVYNPYRQIRKIVKTLIWGEQTSNESFKYEYLTNCNKF